MTSQQNETGIKIRTDNALNELHRNKDCMTIAEALDSIMTAADYMADKDDADDARLLEGLMRLHDIRKYLGEGSWALTMIRNRLLKDSVRLMNALLEKGGYEIFQYGCINRDPGHNCYKQAHKCMYPLWTRAINTKELRQ